MKVSWFEADTPQELNTSIYRVRLPARQLARAGHQCYVSHIQELISGNISSQTWKHLDESEVIVLERLIVAEIHEFIQKMRDEGRRVFATFDDHYGLIPGSTSREIWRGGKDARNGKGSILNEFRQGLRLVDAFMTPSKLLTQDFSAYNSHALYVPNFLDDDLWKGVTRQDSDAIIIGYGGTNLHNRSMLDSGVIPALGHICHKYPKVVVHLQPPFPDVIALFKKFGVRYKINDWQPFADWVKTVATFSVGILPLSGEYDRRRSSLKGQELSMAGVPWICTNEAPYAEAQGCLRVENKPKYWRGALEQLLNDRMLYNSLAEQGRAWAVEMNRQCAEVYERTLIL